ncbi:MAG: sensor histidine kinase [Oscillatoriales cyanobacterium]|nr:MAG: sensor histidine kinase [Oscillatoriales cyanobacterium]
MRHGVQRLQEVSKSLRIMARTDLDTPVKFDIHDGINSAILILKHRLKATQSRPEIQLIADYQDLPEVECFAGQLNQVFTNLLGNAIDALEELNSDRKCQHRCDRPNWIVIETRLLADQSTISICIRDNGVGIAPSIQPRIFDRSFTTKPVGQGTGLGLALCREIVVQRHQGTIAVESELGQSTAFTITLPLKHARVDPST